MTAHIATHGARLVSDFFPDILFRVKTNDPVAYLTFDDGPTSILTRRLLDLLHTADASATFFVLGQNAKDHPELIHAILERGHSIGNHTWSHPDAWRTPAGIIVEELERTTKCLEDITGRPVRHLRPPYGHLSPAMRRWAAEHDQQVVMWDIMPGDFLPSCTTDFITRFVRKNLRPGSVLVVHDNPKAASTLPLALANITVPLRRTGWRFEAL